ncbi:MAG: threonine dehydratase [Proteobacteria bacterium]|nr:threonine dehydratase [Pseudomonadota bacterium]MDA1310728.1 threonine dehydratase [Pseudomonadota bacterium]
MSAYSVTAAEFEATAEQVHAMMSPTPQYNWPLLSVRAGAEVWVKHENQTPTGAFKVRGGLIYVDELLRREPSCAGVIAATRGNHGQSVACAATRRGLKSTVVVPHGNSLEKNAAMQAQGADLIIHGADFQESFEYAQSLAAERQLHLFASFHPLLVRGVGTYAWELLSSVPDLDTVYVPIGMGSGICGVIAARDALGLKTRVVGVVAATAPAYALSFERREAVSTNSADTMADGVACRVPVAEALELIWAGADRVVTVTDDQMKAAMRHYFTDTHNIAEGAGAAPLAALLKERETMAGKRVGLILSGGNIDRTVYQAVLMEAGNQEAQTS